ncbi:hypothetical protein Tco_1163122 [Tanacetum coccineum]
MLDVGEKYKTVEQFKEFLTYYDLANGFSLWYERSCGKKVVAKCAQRPPRWMTEEKTFQCISLTDEHTCVRNFNFGLLVNYKWIGKVFGDKIKDNLEIRLCDIADLVIKKYKCKVTSNQCTNAKKYALAEYEKIIGEHCAMLRSYGKATLDSNHMSTVEAVKDVMPNAEHRQSFFEVDKGCEAVENGFSECFISVIVSVIHKPLLTMLEAIRVIVLERMNKMREISRKWNPGICPNIKKRLEWLKEQQRFCHVIPAGGNLFEVRSGSEGFTVNEGKKTCSFPGMSFWPDQSMYSTVLPPKPKKIPGRPRKKRIESKGGGGSSTRVSKIGRPIKKQSIVHLEDVDVDVRGTVRGRSEQGDNGKAQQGGSKQGSAGVGGSKRKTVSSAGTQIRQGKKRVGTSGFTRWFGLQDEPMQTQDQGWQFLTRHETRPETDMKINRFGLSLIDFGSGLGRPI